MAEAEVSPQQSEEVSFDPINDFSDRLSPMLVKELRQGLRTNSFVALFLVLQGVLGLLVLVTSPLLSDGGSVAEVGATLSRFIFFLFGIGVLLLQPLRGITAISREISQNTIDLMVLTRLSAWRIAWGKWSCIMSQSGLLCIAILPYLILRYFFGGMQLVAELSLLAFLFAAAGALTAIAIALSASASNLLRGILVVTGSAVMIWVIGYLVGNLEEAINLFNFSSLDSTLAAFGLLALALYFSYFFLEMAATAIAPTAENRSTRKRLVGLVAVVASFLLLGRWDLDLAMAAALIVAGLLSLDMFSEKSEFPRTVCEPFLRYGDAGRFIGRFLYPGWATALTFSLVLLGVLTGMVQLLVPGHPDLQTRVFIGYGVMIFPAAMIQLFARHCDNRFSVYLMITLLSAGISILLTTLYHEIHNQLVLLAFGFVPLVLFSVTDQLGTASNRATFMIASAAVAGIYTLIVFAGAAPQLAKLSRLENNALEDGEEDTPA